MAVALLARHTGFTGALAQELPDCKSLRLRRFQCVVGRPSLRRDPHPGGTHLQCGSGVWGDVESITLNEFEAAWRVNAYGALATTREVIPAMKTAGAGAIIFIGATASRRGGLRTAAFAPAKAAQRSLAESEAGGTPPGAAPGFA